MRLHPDAPQPSGIDDALVSLADTIAEALKNAKHPLIICGTSCGNKSLIHAAANIAWGLCESGKPASLAFTMPECNSMGLGLMEAGSIGKAFESAAAEKAETVIILENDLYRRAEKEHVDRFLDSVTNIVVIDSFSNRTTERADAILPAGTFAESSGTLVNNEGRAQHFFKVFVPEGTIEESWQWLRGMLSIAQKPEGDSWKTVHDIAAAMAKESDIFSPVINAAPPPEFRETGQKVPRQSHRYSGRTAMLANKTMHEPPPADDPDSPLSFSMEGYSGMPPGCSSAEILVSCMEFGPVAKQVPDRDRRTAPWRKPGQAADWTCWRTIDISFFDDIPEGFIPDNSKWLFVPSYHIFGSEELSSMAPAIAELSPKPYLALNEDDASRLGLKNGSIAKIMLGEKEYSAAGQDQHWSAAGVSQGFLLGCRPLKASPFPVRGI